MITVILTAQSHASLPATSQRCSIVQESGDDPGEWDHCDDPKSTLGGWVLYDEARLKQSWWISAPGRDRCSYWIKWTNASWGVRQDWRVRNVENASLRCCCSLMQERGAFQPHLNYSEICSNCALPDATLKHNGFPALSPSSKFMTNHSFFIIFMQLFFFLSKTRSSATDSTITAQQWRKTTRSSKGSFVVTILDTCRWWVIINPSWACLILVCDETLQLQHRIAEWY